MDGTIDAGTLDAYGQSLHEQGRGWSLARAGHGRVPLRVADWTCDERPGDDALLALCTGATLDVGCGPGRLTSALTAAGHPALGIDLAPAAVALARARGAEALVRDVFGPVPGVGGWDTVLLADGNIGIGGDPSALLRRCRRLTAPAGRVVLELSAPPVRSRSHLVRLEHAGRSQRSGWFLWASLSVADLADAADRSGLAVLDTVQCLTGRWFAVLARPDVTAPGGRPGAA